MYYRKCLFVIIFILVVNTFAENEWTFQNPVPQNNDLMEAIVFDENSFIAVGDLGTIIKTTDRGANWDIKHWVGGTADVLNDVYFIDENTGWAVGANGKVVKTIDAGVTWELVDVGNNADLYSVYFTSQNKGCIVGAAGTVLVTINGGEAWNPVTIATTENLNKVCFTNSVIGWLVGANGTLYKTTSSGSNWEAIDLGCELDLDDIFFLDPQKGWIAGETGIIFQTTDGGIKWNAQTTNTTRRLYSIHFQEELKGYACGEKGILIKTEDGGSVWSREESGTILDLYDLDILDTKNWMAFGAAGTIQITPFKGSTWNPFLKGISLNGFFNNVFFVNAKTGWVLSYDGYVYKTINGGMNWTRQASYTKGTLNSLFMHDENNGVCVGSRNSILYTDDGCATLKPVLVNTDQHFYAVYFLNEQIGWATGNLGIVMKTEDGGKTWAALPAKVDKSLWDVHFCSPDTGWVVGSDGIIMKTENGGESWITQSLSTSTWLLNVCFINKNIGWVSGKGGLVMKTFDGGTTWERQTTNTNNNAIFLQFFNPLQGWAAGGTYENPVPSIILHTNNGGKTWITCPRITNQVLSAGSFINPDTGWVVGDCAAILKYNGSGELFNHPPGITNKRNCCVYEDSLFTFTGQAFDIENNPVTFAFENYPNWLVPVENTISGNPPAGSADTSFVVIASDGELCDTVLVSVDIKALNKAPVITNISDFTMLNTEEHIIQLDNCATDENHECKSLCWVVTSSDTNLKIILSNRAVKFTAPHWSGSAEVKFKVSDPENAADSVLVTATVENPTLIGNSETNIPTTWSLDQNYPNPFNAKTVIRFGLPQKGDVHLSVYNLQGELIDRLIDKEMPAGYHNITWNADRFASGMYFYKIQAGQFVQTKKLLLVK